jgi:hypothetical protein
MIFTTYKTDVSGRAASGARAAGGPALRVGLPPDELRFCSHRLRLRAEKMPELAGSPRFPSSLRVITGLVSAYLEFLVTANNLTNLGQIRLSVGVVRLWGRWLESWHRRVEVWVWVSQAGLSRFRFPRLSGPPFPRLLLRVLCRGSGLEVVSRWEFPVGRRRRARRWAWFWLAWAGWPTPT